MDLAYVTPQIVVTSMPAVGFRRLYRTKAKDLRRFLEEKHGDSWWIFNFRAEDTGDYTDDAFANRVSRFPWTDHSSPPFSVLTEAIREVQAYLDGKADAGTKIPEGSDSGDLGVQPATEQRVAVLHCKAGQGRSGTVACAYLIAVKGVGWREAIDLFTEARMRPSFGPGVSIKSQQRYLRYTEQWRDFGTYRDMTGQITHIVLHDARYMDLCIAVQTYSPDHRSIQTICNCSVPEEQGSSQGHRDLSYRLTQPAVVSGDVRVAIWRAKRSKKLMGVQVKHIDVAAWFNLFFERPGLFDAYWTDLDGVLGSDVRGSQAFSRLEVRWNNV